MGADGGLAGDDEPARSRYGFQDAEAAFDIGQALIAGDGLRGA